MKFPITNPHRIVFVVVVAFMTIGLARAYCTSGIDTDGEINDSCPDGEIYVDGICEVCSLCEPFGTRCPASYKHKCKRDYDRNGSGECGKYCKPDRCTAPPCTYATCRDFGEGTTAAPAPVYNLNCSAAIETFTAHNQSTASIPPDKIKPTLTPNNVGIIIHRVGGEENQTEFSIGIHGVDYQAIDVNQNVVDNCSVQIIVHDREPPQIMCPSSFLIPTVNGKPQKVDVNVLSAWVYDNSGNWKHWTSWTDVEQPFAVGNTTVTHRATDRSDNTNNCTFVVNIADINLICPLDTPNSNWSAPIIQGDYGSKAFYNCSHQPGDKYGGNTTVECDLYWESKFLDICSFVKYEVERPPTDKSSGDGHTNAVFLLKIFLPILGCLILLVIGVFIGGRSICQKWTKKYLHRPDDQTNDTNTAETEMSAITVEEELPDNIRQSQGDVRPVSVDESRGPGDNRPVAVPNKYEPGSPDRNNLQLPVTPPSTELYDVNETRGNNGYIPNHMQQPVHSPSSVSNSSNGSHYEELVDPANPHGHDGSQLHPLYWTHISAFVAIRNSDKCHGQCLVLTYTRCNGINSSSSSDNEASQIKTINQDELKFNTLIEVDGLQSGCWYRFTLKCTEYDWEKNSTARIAETACKSSISDLLDHPDIVGNLRYYLDPAVQVWKNVGLAYGLTDANINYILFHMDPKKHPAIFLLFDAIKEITMGDDETRTICKLLRELHYRAKEKNVEQAFYLIFDWHKKSTGCEVCTNVQFAVQV